MKPSEQEQLYSFTASVQVASLRHGVFRQSSISAKLLVISCHGNDFNTIVPGGILRSPVDSHIMDR